MSPRASEASARALALRHDFDQGFAAPPRVRDDDTQDMLAIRVGGAPYALILGQTHGLFADRRIVPLPGRSRGFMGVTSLRTGIVAVYSLRTLLGQAETDAPMRWLAMIGESRSVALAFEQFDAYARVSRGHFAQAPQPAPGHVQSTVLIAQERRSVISLDSILQTIAATP